MLVEADIYYWSFGQGGKSLFTASLMLWEMDVGFTYFDEVDTDIPAPLEKGF